MQLTPDEFLRRFAQHILPRGFVRIRSFGFLASSCRDGQLARCRELLEAASPPQATEPVTPALEGDEPPRCPHCQTGVLVLIEDRSRPSIPELVARTYEVGGLRAASAGWNTS